MDVLSGFRGSFPRRLREVRIERFGEHDTGVMTLADALDLPPATWRNYEEGVVMPGEVLLQFIGLTHVTPHWLLTGDGEKYRSDDYGSRFLGTNRW
jgi:hypothetical protein